MARPKKRAVKYDLFPPAGPVREYRPFILAEAKKYSQLYYLDRRDVLVWALHLAHVAEQKFDPKRGKFGTLLRWELRRLHRLCQREYQSNRADGRRGSPRSKLTDLEIQERKQESENRRNIRWGKREPKAKGASPINYTRWKRLVDRSKVIAALKKLRVQLTSDKEIALVDWMAGDISGKDERTMSQAASDAGISNGYASKLVYQLAIRLNFGNV